MTTAGKAPAAGFEISIDGVPRSYRDRLEIAIKGAKALLRAHGTAGSPGRSEASG